MKIRLAFLLCALFSSVWAGQPIQNLQVTLRGKKYDVSDVETVGQLQQKLKDASGIDAKSQGRILFGGKRLGPNDVLEDVGVTNGAQLNMVPGKSSSRSSTIATSKSSSSATCSAPETTASSSSSSSSPGGVPNLEEMMKNSGMDTSKLDELMKSMGGKEGEMPSMQESLDMMQNMMNSPIFQEYMSDPERLEQSRQMILDNPMLKSMMAGMPGMEELLNDPVAWREAMQAAANLYKNMDTNELMKSMMGGMGDTPGGLFDGTLDPTTAAALDELSEGDE